MGTTLKLLFKTLEDCVEILESDLRKSLAESAEIIRNEGDIVIDRTADYHYKEIVSNLGEIKTRIGLVAHHERIIDNLRKKYSRNADEGSRKSVKIDKNYIQKQVQAFSNNANESNDDEVIIIKRRNRNSDGSIKGKERFSDCSPIINESIETWGNYLDQKEKLLVPEVNANEMLTTIKKRVENGNCMRKKKKFVSSTVGLFLEENLKSLDIVDENQVEETEIEIPPAKPKIIDVIYKTKPSHLDKIK